MWWVASSNINERSIVVEAFWEQQQRKKRPASSLFGPAEGTFLNSEYFEPYSQASQSFLLDTL
jgi:hypothetical protein